MKKRQANRQTKRVKAVLDKWVTPLGLRWWNDITWHYHDGDDSSWDQEHGQKIVMATSARWEYLWAHVDVNLSAVADRTDDELEDDIVHELVHILLAEYAECHEAHHLERTCTRLAQAFAWVREAGERNSKDAS